MTPSLKTPFLLLLICLLPAVYSDWANECIFRRSVAKYKTYLSYYTTCCGMFCWNRCQKSRQRSKLVYEYVYYTKDCYGYCSNYDCKACKSIDNCVLTETRCSTSSNHYCLKCEYHRGGEKQAYELVNRGSVSNGRCEQRCSWRLDSQFCFPGNCPSTPSSCTCAPGFSGNNCLTTITTPAISPCTGKLRDGSDGFDLACDSNGTSTYSSMKAGTLDLDWTTTYNVSIISDYMVPYYVNSSGFGIVEARFEWNLQRENFTLDGDIEYCFIADIFTMQVTTKECTHTLEFKSELQHNDILWFQVQANTSGFIKMNNYDDPDSVTVSDAQFYSTQHKLLSNTVIFDFLAPVHCRALSPPCTYEIISISEVYTKNGTVKVSWNHTQWEDDTSGIQEVTCEIYKIIPDSKSVGTLHQIDVLDGQQLSIRDENISYSEIVFRLPETGVFSVILRLVDNAGNTAKARRFLLFDDQSSISVSDDSPIRASGSVVNNGVLWLGSISGQVTIIWTGHFYNAFHRDNNLLAPIQEMDPPLPAKYDETTGQPPSARSREAIPNAEGITRFEFDFAVSNSKKSQPVWETVEGIQTTQEISIFSEDGDHISVWLKAYDVMGNTREDSAKIYLDSSSPLITNFGYSYQNLTGTSGTIRTDNGSIVQIFFETHDDESGISLIQWSLLNMEEPSIVYGEGDIKKTYTQDPDDEDCSPQTCNCLARDDLDLCFYTSYSVFLDLNTMTNVPKGETNCTFKILVYNNAMKQSEETLEVTIQHSIPMSTANPGLGENSNQSGGGHAASVGIALGILAGIAVIATVAVVSRYLIRRKNKIQDAKYTDKSKNSWTKWRMKFPTMDSLPRVKIAWR